MQYYRRYLAGEFGLAGSTALEAAQADEVVQCNTIQLSVLCQGGGRGERPGGPARGGAVRKGRCQEERAD